jgi:DNA-binding GntR family transcriptional regulator
MNGLALKKSSTGLAPLSLTPLHALSLRDQAYELIKDGIASADIYGNDDALRLDERQLIADLGVSRTPVREALTLLEQEGFVRTVPRRGIFIVRKTKREIIEMIELWAALESMAARLATQRATDADIQGLRTLFKDFMAKPPHQHIDEYSDANIEFHRAVIRLGGSTLIEDISKNLFIHIDSIRRVTIRKKDRADRSIGEHLNIIEALERRDTAQAEHLTREHTLGLARHIEHYCDFLD